MRLTNRIALFDQDDAGLATSVALAKADSLGSVLVDGVTPKLYC